MIVRVPTIPDPRFVQCLRLAALRMLLETEGRPARIVVDIDQLMIEALTIFDGVDEMREVPK
jgi:hypothetical protein